MIRDEYAKKLQTLTTQIEAFTLLPDDEILSMPDCDSFLNRMEVKNDEAIAFKAILEEIDYPVGAMSREPDRAHYAEVAAPGPTLAQKSTLELLNLTARHLSGQDVDVLIEQPYKNNYIGLCTWNLPGAKSAATIRISPDAVIEGDRYLNVFLHEVAHAKLHTDYERSRENAWKMERDAKQQADYWTAYARTHADPTLYVGEGNGAARQLRSKLITLLTNQEAAETIGTY